MCGINIKTDGCKINCLILCIASKSEIFHQLLGFYPSSTNHAFQKKNSLISIISLKAVLCIWITALVNFNGLFVCMATSTGFKIRNVLFHIYVFQLHVLIQYPNYLLFHREYPLKSLIYLQLFTPLEPMSHLLLESMQQMQTCCLFRLICLLQKKNENFSFNILGPDPMDICTTSTSQPCEIPGSDVTILEGHTSEVKRFINCL